MAKKLKVVIDTNIIVSRFWGGNPKKVTDLFQSSGIELLTSVEILIEVRRVLEKVFKKDMDIVSYVDLIADKATIISPRKRLKVVERDPDDDKFVECAVEGKADYIVSGDKDLLDIGEYKGISIVNAKEFLSLL